MFKRILAASAAYGYSALLLIALVYYEQYVEYIWYVFSGLAILFLVVWVSIIGIKRLQNEYVIMAGSPFLLLVSGLAFFVLADSDMLRTVQSVLVAFGLFFILRALYFFFWHSVKYQPNSLQIQIKYINVVSMFFVATFLYAVEIFLNFSLVVTASIQFVLLVLLLMQHVYIQRLLRTERLTAIVGAFLLTQVFIAIAFLPFLVYVKGIVFMLVYFVVMELYENSLKGVWNRKSVLTLILLFFIISGILLATTPWY
ncbi:MAG: hypothetical protein ACPGO5_03435 [Patescibacteria group bacterium]